MAALSAGSDEAARIDGALAQWRQGDVSFDAPWFLHVGDTTSPLTDASAESEGDGPEPLMTTVEGLVVVSQTCDIARKCVERPYVEVSPLVLVDEQRLSEIKRGRRPAYLYLPFLAERHLVGDLDRTMTLEKSLVASWAREPGWSTDAEGRVIAAALARKRQRPAFPDDFVSAAGKLQGQIAKRHSKDSVEGRALRALDEIRVQPSPTWEAEAVSLFFFFVRSSTLLTFEGAEWSDMLNAWLALFPPGGRFTLVEGIITSLDDMTAREYVDSDRLDLDHLSRGST